ncbi:RNase adapter RapZ [Acidisphaera sp. L21]|uniref:RNase adapter RapZ n=1 Tax=Acidisphaera sp. L21 TaxID=1641851 RepID=UPI00131C96BF|nr:RNase adapter RapZ [Acidisphaera sp. L21]
MTPRRVVLVTGLSGAGRSSILRVLEDLGYEAVDNPPLTLTEELVSRGDRPVAIGVDARSRGFDADIVLSTLERLRLNQGLRPELVFAYADEAALLRRFTETRRRHPLAPGGRVVDGIAQEMALTAPLREVADLVIDTSDTPLPALRRQIESRFASDRLGVTVSLMSFGYPHGLPREADLVFDARFLRNPHYDPYLRPKTGLDEEVAAYVEADPDFAIFFGQIEAMLRLLLPRFAQEGKKYVTIAVGCTGGRHRSVRIVEKLASHMRSLCLGNTGLDMRAWQVTVAHRELLKAGVVNASPPETISFQAQEA